MTLSAEQESALRTGIANAMIAGQLGIPDGHEIPSAVDGTIEHIRQGIDGGLYPPYVDYETFFGILTKAMTYDPSVEPEAPSPETVGVAPAEEPMETALAALNGVKNEFAAAAGVEITAATEAGALKPTETILVGSETVTVSESVEPGAAFVDGRSAEPGEHNAVTAERNEADVNALMAKYKSKPNMQAAAKAVNPAAKLERNRVKLAEDMVAHANWPAVRESLLASPPKASTRAAVLDSTPAAEKLPPEPEKPIAMDEAEPWFKLYTAAKAKAKEVEDIIEMAKGKLTAILSANDGNVVVIGGKPVATWKMGSRTTVSTAVLKEKDPELWAKYATTGESRSFVIL